MKKRWLLLILCLLAAPVLGGAMYKWVDEEGNTHYSERPPEEGAEELKLPKATTYKPGPIPRPTRNDRPAADGQGYEKLAITSPKMNETVRNSKGDVQVQFSLTPGGLKPGHRYQLFLDGSALDQSVTQSTVLLSGLDRGSHTVQVKVVNSGGTMQISSQSVIFHLRKDAVESEDNSPDDNSEAYGSSYSSDSSDYKSDASYDSDATYKSDSTYDSDATYKSDSSYDTDATFKGDATYKSDSSKYKSGAKTYSSGGGGTSPSYKPNYNQSK